MKDIFHGMPSQESFYYSAMKVIFHGKPRPEFFYYSASARSFYAKELHGTRIPADVMLVTAAQHAELFAALAAGKEIRPDANGRPVAVDRS